LKVMKHPKPGVRFAVASLVVVAVAGCANNFDVFEPTGDGGNDSGAGGDGSGGSSGTSGTTSGGTSGASGGTSSGGTSSGASGGTSSGGLNDAGPDTARPDAACTPSQTCTTNAQACAAKCHNCRGQQCDNGLQACLQQCQDTCNACTSQAGCPAPAACANASK
jgi:hypothetical protein